MELDLELSVLTLEVLCLIFLGELDVDGELVASVVTDDLLLKAGDEVAGTELEVIFLSLAALKSLAVAEALEVDDDGVAVLSGTVLYGTAVSPFSAARSSTVTMRLLRSRTRSISSSIISSVTSVESFSTSMPL